MQSGKLKLPLGNDPSTAKHYTTYKFNDFLAETGLSYQDYLKAVRASISRDTFFIERQPQHIFVNAFMVKVQPISMANMDVQIV